MKVYQSETNTYIDMPTIGKVRYTGESFGVDSLTNGLEYFVVGVLEQDYLRIVDDSGEDYLYPVSNLRPIDGSSVGGQWEIIEDYTGDLEKLRRLMN